MGSEEGQKHRLMKIRLEKEEHSGDFVISAAVEIESDDPSWAMRKAKELLAHILNEQPRDQGEAGADGL